MKFPYAFHLLRYQLRALWRNPSPDPYVRMNEVHYEVDQSDDYPAPQRHPSILMPVSNNAGGGWLAEHSVLPVSLTYNETQSEVPLSHGT